MKEITLTVQPCGKGEFRLGISSKNSKCIFKKRGAKVYLKLLGIFQFTTRTKCDPPGNDFNRKKCKKGYDLYDIRIHNWIKSNDFHCYKPRIPTKLKFKYYVKSKKLEYVEIKQFEKRKCSK